MSVLGLLSFRLLKGEPLVSKAAVAAQYVFYPAVMLAYCAYVPEEELFHKKKITPVSA